MKSTPPLPLGTKTRYGPIVSILWIGERYYAMVAEDGFVALMPAVDIEAECRRADKV